MLFREDSAGGAILVSRLNFRPDKVSSRMKIHDLFECEYVIYIQSQDLYYFYGFRLQK